MYKTLILTLIAIVGMACGSTALSKQSHHIQHHTAPPLSLDICPLCINGADESINILLELILNTGVLGSCQALCTALEEKTKSTVAGVICTLACDFVGIEEFIKLIDEADLDPIYYCEIARCCPVNDHGDANITVFSILPATGPKGTTFAIGMTYVSLNGTGTGELVVEIHCPDRIPLDGSFLIEAKKPGTYNERITIKAEPDPRCDPTQEECETWMPGTYNVTVILCNGECGSKHPHSATYSLQRGSFEVTA